MENMAIYPDSSGNSKDQRERAIKEILNRKEYIALVEAFIKKHGDLLDGSSWDVCLFNGPKIRIFSGSGVCYRQKWMAPKDFAFLIFANASWERVKKDYCDDYDYVTVIDGVTFELSNAEREKRVRNTKPKRTALIQESASNCVKKS